MGWDEETADLFLNTYLGTIYQEMRPKEEAVETIKQLKQEHELILIYLPQPQFQKVEQVTIDWLRQ